MSEAKSDFGTELRTELKTTPAGQFASDLTPEALARRQHQAYKMRLAGASFDDIARALGVARSTAARDVAAMHGDYCKDAFESVEQMRQQAASRLDVALFAIDSLVKKGNLPAIDRLLTIERRRAALLGLDAPRRVEMTGKDGGPLEVEGNIRERWSPEEARQKAQEIVRRLGVAERETARLMGQSVEVAAREVQTPDERN